MPEFKSRMRGDGQTATRAISEGFEWFEVVRESVSTDGQSMPQNKTKEGRNERHAESAVSSLLPLFLDQAKSPAMICHSLNIIEDCVDHLNPGRIPVMTMDGPLYVLTKQIQWTFPERNGGKQFVIMFGKLHTELTFLKSIGGWLEESGWTAALTEAKSPPQVQKTIF